VSKKDNITMTQNFIDVAYMFSCYANAPKVEDNQNTDHASAAVHNDDTVNE
jgi:hypothetical protein